MKQRRAEQETRWLSSAANGPKHNAMKTIPKNRAMWLMHRLINSQFCQVYIHTTRIPWANTSHNKPFSRSVSILALNPKGTEDFQICHWAPNIKHLLCPNPIPTYHLLKIYYFNHFVCLIFPNAMPIRGIRDKDSLNFFHTP